MSASYTSTSMLEYVKIWHNDNPFQKYTIIYIRNKALRNEWYMN